MRTILAALAVAMATSTLAYAQPRTIEIAGGEGEENRLGRVDRSWPIVQTPWRQTDDLMEIVGTELWTVRVLVDELGVVTEAVVTDGPSDRREAARALALGLRYRPFEQDGEAVCARFTVAIFAVPADYIGPADRSFPATFQAEDVRIRLVRSGCYGNCPAYDLEITGSGQVRYIGRRHVAREGEHSWTIPPERISELVEVFRRVDYFNLRGYYGNPVVHFSARQVTSLRIGGQEKFVSDNGTMDEFNSSIVPSDALAQLPWADQLALAAVGEVESAIDRIAGVEPYVGPRVE